MLFQQWYKYERHLSPHCWPPYQFQYILWSIYAYQYPKFLFWLICVDALYVVVVCWCCYRAVRFKTHFTAARSALVAGFLFTFFPCTINIEPNYSNRDTFVSYWIEMEYCAVLRYVNIKNNFGTQFISYYRANVIVMTEQRNVEKFIQTKWVNWM